MVRRLASLSRGTGDAGSSPATGNQPLCSASNPRGSIVYFPGHSSDEFKCHGGADEKRFFINFVALMDAYGTPGVASRLEIEGADMARKAG